MVITPARKAIIALAFIALAVLAYSRMMRWFASDEDRIASIVYDIADAAEERNLRRLSGHLHPDFHAEEFSTHFDRQTSIDMLRLMFRQYGHIRVSLRGLRIRINDDNTAEALFIATVTAARNIDAPKQDLTRQRGSERFRVTFARDDGTWKVLQSALVRSTAELQEWEQ